MAIRQMPLASTRDTRKRALGLLLFAVIVAGCSYNSGEPSGFTLQRGQVVRRFGCHIALEDTFDNNAQYADLRFACRVPESALNEKQWWGDRPKPKLYTLDEGDCILLDTDFFCVEDIQLGKSVSFRAKYVTDDDSGTVIKHHNRRR